MKSEMICYSTDQLRQFYQQGAIGEPIRLRESSVTRDQLSIEIRRRVFWEDVYKFQPVLMGVTMISMLAVIILDWWK